MKASLERRKSAKTIVKKCHVCGSLMEHHREIEKCDCCHKSFLPMNYFSKVHAKNSEEFKNLFCDVEEIHEEDIIKGITVIW